jgi:hypothetical protein
MAKGWDKGNAQLGIVLMQEHRKLPKASMEAAHVFFFHMTYFFENF